MGKYTQSERFFSSGVKFWVPVICRTASAGLLTNWSNTREGGAVCAIQRSVRFARVKARN